MGLGILATAVSTVAVVVFCKIMDRKKQRCEDLLENKRNQGIAPKAVRLFARRVYEIRKVDYFLICISSNNQHSKYVFEKMGAVKIGEEETDFSKFVEMFRKIAEEDGLDLEKFRHWFGEGDDEIVYCYSLNPNTFL